MQSPLFLALADSLLPLHFAFSRVYQKVEDYANIEKWIDEFWNYWVHSDKFDFEKIPLAVEKMAPNLEEFTDRTACYAQDVCILFHAAISSAAECLSGNIIYYYFEPLEQIIERERADLTELPSSEWEESVLMKDPRVNRAFRFVEHNLDYLSGLEGEVDVDYDFLRKTARAHRWTPSQLGLR